jgi:hypothetical protein
MQEFVPDRRVESRPLESGESIEIEFTPRNRGWIVIVAEAAWRDTEPIRRRVELLRAGEAKPLSEKTDRGLGVATLVTYHLTGEISDGDVFACRVTNLDDDPAEFTLRLLYPGDRAIDSQEISSSLIEGFVNKLLGETEIRITRGEDQSYIRLPGALGLDDVRFTIPDFRKKVAFLTIQEYPRMIESRDLTMSLINASRQHPNGGLGVTITFAGEEGANEINGTFHGRLSDMRLVIQLGLTMDGSAIAYNRVHVTFDFELDLKGIPDWLFDPLFHYSDALKQAVEDNLLKLLRSPETKETFSKGLTEQVRAVIPEGDILHSLRVIDGTVVLKHYLE